MPSAITANLSDAGDDEEISGMEKTMKIRLWIVRETEKARLYSKVPTRDQGRTVDPQDCIWIPRSIVEHTTKRGAEHEVDLPDWFIEREHL